METSIVLVQNTTFQNKKNEDLQSSTVSKDINMSSSGLNQSEIKPSFFIKGLRQDDIRSYINYVLRKASKVIKLAGKREVICVDHILTEKAIIDSEKPKNMVIFMFVIEDQKHTWK